MSLTTFFIGLLIVFLVAAFVRAFWLQLLLMWSIAVALFWITIGSFCSAIIWMVFVENYTSGPIDGFWRTLLFFFITYSTIVVVGVLITLDIYTYFKGYIRDIFKK